MIRVKSVSLKEGNKVIAALYADTREEVTDHITGASIYGLEDVVELEASSTVLTADMDFAQYDSKGVWHWS